MKTTVKIAFDTLSNEIDRAVANGGFNSVCECATELGLVGGQTDSKFTLGYKYEGTDATGAVIDLYVRSYDPSGPMQNLPDINRFTVRVVEGGHTTAQYDREYED